MAGSSSARVLLKRHRESLNLSLREAAEQIGTNHVTLRDWELGNRVPSADYRAAIERWSGGTIAADSWPLSSRERARIARLASVGLGTPKPTGTDGG